MALVEVNGAPSDLSIRSMLSLSHAAVAAALTFAYALFVVRFYAGAGFTFEPSAWRIVQAVVAISFLSVTMHFTRQKPYVCFAFNFFFVFSFIPVSILYSMSAVSVPFYYLNFLPFMALAVVSQQYPRVRLPRPELSKTGSRVLLGGLCLLALAPLVNAFGLPTDRWGLLLFRGVYEVREGFTESPPPFGTYLAYWLPRVLLPTLLIVAMREKKWALSALTLVGFVYVFLVTGVRSAYAIGPVVVVAFVVVLWFGASLDRLIVGMNLGIAAACTVFTIFDTSIAQPTPLSRLLVRRTFFVPGLLGDYYYEFFSQNGFVYLSASRIGFWTQYPFDLTPPMLIGELYADGASANTGFVADGYMNGGLVGVVIYSIVLAFFLKFVDDLDFSYIFLPVFALSLYSVLATSLPTAMLTHGVLLFFFLRWPTITSEDWPRWRPVIGGALPGKAARDRSSAAPAAE